MLNDQIKLNRKSPKFFMFNFILLIYTLTYDLAVGNVETYIMVLSTAQTYDLAEGNIVLVRDYILVVAATFGMYSLESRSCLRVRKTKPTESYADY